MVIAKLNKVKGVDALEVSRVLGANKTLIFIEPILDPSQFVDMSIRIQDGAYDCVVFDEGAIFDEGAYQLAHQFVELNADKIKVVVYQYPN